MGIHLGTLPGPIQHPCAVEHMVGYRVLVSFMSFLNKSNAPDCCRREGREFVCVTDASCSLLPAPTEAEEIGKEDPWFHDVFHSNGTAYSAEELKAVWWVSIGSQLRL